MPKKIGRTKKAWENFGGAFLKRSQSKHEFGISSGYASQYTCGFNIYCRISTIIPSPIELEHVTFITMTIQITPHASLEQTRTQMLGLS